ncbi:MAG: hypothetical protein SFU98_11125 [Leptospiraceae bacterium]|nr:hypothetical protein [Leptospiraceae bacterium]
MKIIILCLLLVCIHCISLNKDLQKNQSLSSLKNIQLVARENIEVHDSVNGEQIFTIEEGEIFFREEIPENKEWSKVYFENKFGYILKSKNTYPVLNSSLNITEKIFIAYNKTGTPLCSKLPIDNKCSDIVKTVPYLEKLYFVKPYQINDGKGTWFKVESDSFVGFINRKEIIPESIFQAEKVDSFKKKFQKICSKKEPYLSKDTHVCYSTKMFNNGDAGESWKERVYFMIDENSIQFRYGRKYLETFGLIFKVESIEQNKFKVHYLDSDDFSENTFLVEINFKKKTIYAPMPETLMQGTYREESTELVEFKNGLKEFR